MSDLVIGMHSASLGHVLVHIFGSPPLQLYRLLSSLLQPRMQPCRTKQNISEVNSVTRAREEEDVKECIETRVSGIQEIQILTET